MIDLKFINFDKISAMDSILIHPHSEEQVRVFEQMAKVLNLPYERERRQSAYNADFVAKIKESKKQAEDGQTVKISLDEIWK